MQFTQGAICKLTAEHINCKTITAGCRGFSCVHKIFVKPELRLNTSTVNTNKIFDSRYRIKTFSCVHKVLQCENFLAHVHQQEYESAKELCHLSCPHVLMSSHPPVLLYSFPPVFLALCHNFDIFFFSTVKENRKTI